MEPIDNQLSKEIEAVERQINLDKATTALKKVQFANDIKNGLGKQIRANPNKVKIIKKPWYLKVRDFFGVIFTKF